MTALPPGPAPPRGPAWPWLALALAATAGMYLLALKGVLFAPGAISQNWDQSFPPFASQLRVYGDISGSTLDSLHEMGFPAPMNGMSLYFDQLVRHGLAGLGGGLLARWLNLAYALAGAAGFWLLARRLTLCGPAALLTCLVSQFNPRTYSLALSGHTEAGFAYALAPWILLLADGAIQSERRRVFLAGCLAAGMLTALACSSPFGVTLVGLLLALYGLAAMAVSRSLKPVLALLVIGLATLTLHLNWILPTASGAGLDKAFKHNLSVQDIQAEYVHKYREYSAPPRQAMIGHTDNLGMGTEYAYPVEAPRDAWWKPSAFGLLGLALLGLICPVGNRRLKVFAGLALLVSFWLLTGDKTLPGMFLYEAVLARVKVLFFFMARPTRWLLAYYAALALLAGLGVEAVRRRTFWASRRWPDRALAGLVTVILAVYLCPWWSGQLTVPKNDTTQTMALTPQTLRPEEERLVAAIHDDPGLYRVTVFPTISSPTGNIPAPPGSALTRSFALLGKDSLVGPAFMGQPYGTFLLSLAHRKPVSTDAYGRLLGLGAVKRLVWDSQEPYLSYLDFGWMPQTRRGSETLPDPRGVLAPFLAAQGDLARDPAWSFGPFVTLDNADALPRVRAVAGAGLAAGGFPLLASLAELEEDIPARTALCFATDVDASDLDRLGAARQGLYVHNDAWPELLLPLLAPLSPLSEERWHPARRPGVPVPEGWQTLTERWHQALWFTGSPLNGLALWSQAPAELSVPLPGKGPHRVFLRAGSLPGQHGLDIRLGEALLAATASADPFDRGWRWLDLGVLELDGGQALTVSARGRGAVVAGVLAVPVNEFSAALAQLDARFPPRAGTTVVAEAEACVDPSGIAGPQRASGRAGHSDAPGGLYTPVRDIPLLAPAQGLTLTTRDLGVTGLDGSGLGLLAAEGDTTGEAVFQVDFPRAISGFSLVSYPRLFGDPAGVALARAEWSTDGQAYHPLYQVHGRTDGQWEHVYDRREEVSVAVPATRLWLRFTLRQAQLPSLGNPPNQPMTLTVTPAEPFPGAPSMGQAVLLPAAFSPKAMRPGPYAVRARLLTPQGPRWQDVGTYEPDAQGIFHIALDRTGQAAPEGVATAGAKDGKLLAAGPALPTKAADKATADAQTGGFQTLPGQDAPMACDLFEIASLPRPDAAPATPALDTARQSPARYTSQGAMPAGGLVVFSKSFHPGWQAVVNGTALPQVKAFGSMNAYMLPDAPSDQLELSFRPDHIREVGLSIVITAWVCFGVLLAGLLAWPLVSRCRKG